MIAILLLLSGIVMAVYPRAKVSASVASCKQNIRQQVMALNMYGADYEGYEPVHETIDFPAYAMRRPFLLEAYAGGNGIMYCPITPQCAKDKLYSTYIFSVKPEKNSPLYNTASVQFERWFADPNSQYPVIHCLVHDELHFHPSERHLSDATNPPYLVWLTRPGAIKTGRYPIFRGGRIAEMCSK
ncbi:MAG: hypothetical protein KDC26_00445 [Armatimonadetes bacterium]|nr:hypothetical protein [Armatimonadota bacterium]